jgi:Glycosyl transferase family 64 domain
MLCISAPRPDGGIGRESKQSPSFHSRPVCTPVSLILSSVPDALLKRASAASIWSTQAHQRRCTWAPRGRNASRASSCPCADGQLTVIVNTWKHPDLLRAALHHYTQCPVVQRVHVNWAESATPPNLSSEACCGTLVTFATPLVSHNDTCLNTRFLPIPGALRVLAIQ